MGGAVRFLMLVGLVGCVAEAELGKDTAEAVDTDTGIVAPVYELAAEWACGSDLSGQRANLLITVESLADEPAGIACVVSQDGDALSTLRPTHEPDGLWRAFVWGDEIGLDCGEPEAIGVVCEAEG